MGENEGQQAWVGRLVFVDGEVQALAAQVATRQPFDLPILASQVVAYRGQTISQVGPVLGDDTADIGRQPVDERGHQIKQSDALSQGLFNLLCGRRSRERDGCNSALDLQQTRHNAS